MTTNIRVSRFCGPCNESLDITFTSPCDERAAAVVVAQARRLKAAFVLRHEKCGTDGRGSLVSVPELTRKSVERATPNG